MSALQTFLNGVLGTYSAITYQYGNEVIIPDGFAGVDWPYLIRAFVFVIVLWSVLRMIGALLCRM